jgi:cation transport ATPase
MIWLAPFAAVCAAWRLWAPALLCAGAFAVTLAYFPGRYFDLVDGDNLVVLVVGLRNVLLLAALTAMLVALARSTPRGVPPRSG